jgi:hypothetical protein
MTVPDLSARGLAAALAAAVIAVSPAVRAAQPVVEPAHSIRVELRGAVALVTVTRTLPSGRPGTASETILDVALPNRSALLEVELASGAAGSGSAFHKVAPLDAGKAKEAYVESLRAMGLAAGEQPFDDDARYRIRVAAPSRTPSRDAQIRYRFSTILEVRGDRYQVSFPAAPELSPVPADVEVRAEPRGSIAEITIGGAPHPLPSGAAGHAQGRVSTRSRWSVSFVLAGGRKGGDRDSPHLDALTSVAPAPERGSAAVAYAVAAGAGVPRESPDRVLLLIDRSRSVGPAGLAAERDVARRLLEALPPSVRFDALFFERGQKRLFPVARAATREAIAALEEEMVPDRLANGTDLPGALRAAGELLRREATSFAPRTLLVVLTDGAIGRLAEDKAGGSLFPFLGPLPGIALMTAVISVRPDDDPRVGAVERRLLRTLAAGAALGGVERELRASDGPAAVVALLEVLRGGGELYGIDLEAKRASARVADVIAPAEGASGIVAVPGTAKLPLRLAHTARGQERRVATRPVTVEARWLAPLLAPGAPSTRLYASAAGSALIEPVVRPPSPPPGPGIRGYMERSVVRDALSIAFTPRARACYVSRSGATPADRDLAGRVRLALDLVRGEVAGARVEASTLSHADVERCLRDAAFALDVPRAYRNDEPVTAVLNLVFRPRTPERRGPADDPAFGRELDLIVEEALKEPGNHAGAPAATPPPADASPPASAPER